MRNSSSAVIIVGVKMSFGCDFGAYAADNSISNSCFGTPYYCCSTIDYGSSNNCSNNLG